jgi:holo-[acyl-carrier protein] synthase
VSDPEGGADGASPGTGDGRLVGLGIDIVDVQRLERVLARRPRLSHRLFTDDERAYAGRLAHPGPTLAGRFAVKEALMKSLGVGLGAFAWRDVEVRRLRGGRPGLVVTGRAADLAARRGVGTWQVSITHTEAVASAVVAALA